MLFRTKKSFGPKIQLTDNQIEKIEAKVHAAGLTCDCENSWTGSAYISIGMPEWEQSGLGHWYHDADDGMGSRADIAKIRLSGHDEGRRQDSTHTCIGSKANCMANLNKWIIAIIEKHGENAKAILAVCPGTPVARREPK